MAESSRQLTDYDNALKFILKAKEIQGANSATTNARLTLAYSKQHWIDKAMELDDKTLNIIKENSVVHSLADCYDRIAEVYQDQNDQEKAITVPI